MKLVFYFAFSCWLSQPASAATIALSGTIEYEAPQDQLIPATIDYLLFSISEASQVSFEFSWPCCEPYPARYTAQVVAMVGLTLLGDRPISIFPSEGSPLPQEHTLDLAEGSYALVISEEDSWAPRGYYHPIGYGLGAAGPANYSAMISGHNLSGLSIQEGNLDGTYTITTIPEPSTAALIGGSALLLWQRNRSARKANRVEVTELRPSPLPHHPACGSAPGGSTKTR